MTKMLNGIYLVVLVETEKTGVMLLIKFGSLNTWQNSWKKSIQGFIPHFYILAKPYSPLFIYVRSISQISIMIVLPYFVIITLSLW